jgi:hypothetical protein
MLSKTEIEKITNVFDPVWYCESYPDVRLSGMNPLDHYFNVGLLLGRNLGPSFDSLKYTKQNGLKDETVLPLQHSPPEEGKLNQEGAYTSGINSKTKQSYLDNRISNYGIHESINTFREVQNLVSSTALREFGYTYLSPVLSHYLRRVVSALSANYTPVCLAREGFLFKNALQSLHDQLLIKLSVKPLYLKVSRTLLFKSLIGSDKNCPELYESGFSDTFAAFLSGRCGMSASFIKCHISSEDANKYLSLPTDAGIAQGLINKYKKQINDATINTRVSLVKYLKSLGLHENPAPPLFLDLGYAGTIQKLLTRLLDRDTYGIYVISSCPGNHPVGNKSAIMKGTLKEDVKFGDGYLPLERSLFWECLLTSQEGQMLDIYEISKGNFDFIYGPAAGAQRFSHYLNELHQGAIQGILDHFHHGIEWSTGEIEALCKVQTSNAWAIPRLIHNLFNLDDSTSGYSLISPLRIHHMVL